MSSALELWICFFPVSQLVETFVFDLLSERCIPRKICGVRSVLFEFEPAMSRVGSVLIFIFVSEELNVFVFVGFGILYPVSSVLWVVVPVGESRYMWW